jgi:hypothetical protein
VEAFFTCRNPFCEKHDIRIEREIEHGYVRDYCKECSQKGKVEVTHKGLMAESMSELNNIMGGMVKEYSLLKRLVKADASSKEDNGRISKLEDILDGMKCPACGQDVIKHGEEE